MLTVLHTLANSAGLFKGPEVPAPPSSSAQFKKAVQNLALIRKVILTENLKEEQEQVALKHLDQLLDLLSVNSLASLTTAQLQDIAAALYAPEAASKDLKEILASIRTTITTTKVTRTTKTTIVNGTSTTIETKEEDNVSVTSTSTDGPSSAVTVVDDHEQESFSLSLRSKLTIGINNSAKDLHHQLTSGNLAVEHVAYALSNLWSKAGVSNATGSALAPQVLKMSTRTNAASAILGAITSPASKGSAVSTFASSSAIVNMVPNLYQIAQSGTPTVFHVAAEATDANFNILRGDYSDVLVARETGFVYLTSNSVQEAYDVAILAHAIAAGTKQSVIHILDGVQTSQEVATIRTVRDQEIAAFVQNEARRSVAAQDEDALASAIEGIFTRASSLLGRQYHAFEYTGPKDAETVAVVFGPASASAKSLGDKGWVKALVQQAVDTKGKVDLSAVVASEVQAEEGITQVVFWETSASAPVSAHVAKHIQSALGNHVQHRSSVNSYRHTAVIESRVQFAKHSSSVAFQESALASYATVQGVSILAEYNVVDSLKHGATLVLNAPWSVEELETKTSVAFRLALGAKEIKVLLIDLDNVAKEVGLEGVGKTLLGHVTFLKTHSANLKEAAFGAIESQYVASNRDVLKDLIASLIERVDKEVIEVPQNPNWLTLEADKDAVSLPKHVVPTVRSDANAFDASNAPVAATAAVAEEGEVVLGKTSNWHQAAWQLLFSEAYETKQQLADEGHSYLVKITENRRLTPTTYDRNVFHIEFDTTNTGLKYEIGDALGIHGWNDTQEVLDFIEFYGEKPETVVVTPRALPKNAPEGTVPRHQTNTLFQVLQQSLDLFGRPSKRFYADLIPYAKNEAERERLSFLISAEGANEFKARVDETLTHADILREFPSAHPTVPQLLAMLPAIKPRHYSIASSMKAHPNSVHLLIVAVEWTAPSGKQRFGQCTRYLTSLGVGDIVTVSIKPSVMTLPPSPHQPVIMAGLGTGMAPFRAFIQERAWQKAQGIEVGPMILYFGSRNRANEYLYGEELEAYHADGLLTHLRLAFSRDQKEKVYIQNKMNEDGTLLHKYLLDSSLNGHFYLCGPTWPAGDVKDAIVQSFMDGENCASIDANRLVNKLKEEERYVLEVY
ncbi:hypothetical protein BGZ94_005155 [Podila epigama]|nr:hypothetical protein BGZ94_005155 [Podila epigama]